MTAVLTLALFFLLRMQVTELRRRGHHPFAPFAFLGLAGATNFLHDLLLRDFFLHDFLFSFCFRH